MIQEGTTRKLLSGSGLCEEQSAINVEDLREHIYDYSLLSLHFMRFIKKPSRVLVVGLGGGVIPREISKYLPETYVDIIEIDPEIISIAKKFFFFEQTDKIIMHCGDALVVMRDMKELYDVILVDAFSSNYIPFHLMSIEFVKIIYSLLLEQGVVAVNCSNFHPSFYSQINTYREAFGDNIYRLDGLRNSCSTILYVVKGEIEPKFEIDDLYSLTPKKIDITENIKDAKIFTLTHP